MCLAGYEPNLKPGSLFRNPIDCLLRISRDEFCLSLFCCFDFSFIEHLIEFPMATPPTPARLAQLTQTACKIFSTVYNPTAVRSGNKILRERLVGPSVSSYYPQPLIHFRDIKAAVPQLKLIDTDEKERLDEIARRKRRGKGAPKKGTYINWNEYRME